MGRSRDISSAYDAAAVTTSDSTVIPETRALYVGVTGDVAVKMAGGSTATFKAAPVGVLPIQVVQVMQTGTTATNIIALY